VVKNKVDLLKGELGELVFYIRNTPASTKILVVSILSNSPWLPKNLKNGQNEVTEHFLVGNTFRQATMQVEFFVSVTRWHELDPWLLNQDAIWKKNKR